MGANTMNMGGNAMQGYGMNTIQNMPKMHSMQGLQHTMSMPGYGMPPDNTQGYSMQGRLSDAVSLRHLKPL
jgi:hypothetical protein